MLRKDLQRNHLHKNKIKATECLVFMIVFLILYVNIHSKQETSDYQSLQTLTHDARCCHFSRVYQYIIYMQLIIGKCLFS